MIVRRFARSMSGAVAAIVLAACSNGRGSLQEQETPPPTAPAQGTYSIGGTVAGLTGSGLVLQNNGGGNLAITGDGPFTFAGAQASGAAYNVSVLTQPSSPAQTCTVASGAGSVASANVTNIVVSCSTTPRYSVGGTVSGLLGGGLVLQNNAGDDLPIGADGTFTFATTLANEAAYNVTVRTHPAGQNCAIQNASGAIASANVASVQVTCAANQFTVGGTVSGLRGSGLVVRLNGGNDLRIPADGPFAFPTMLTSGATYAVSVFADPKEPTQRCTPANQSGAIAAENITNITITCVTQSYTVGGQVRSYSSSGLALRLNGTQDLPIMGNGDYAFPTALLSGTPYTVEVTQPIGLPVQECSAENRTGVVRDAAVRDVIVTCANKRFTIGGTVSGLLGTGVTLHNNNGDVLRITANGTFTFPTGVPSGARYAVTAPDNGQPSNPTQRCSIANGSGTIARDAISNIEVTCTTSSFRIGGVIHNLIGSGLLLRNNGVDTVQPTASGEFTFPAAVPSGAGYSVDVAQQPTAPSQTCSLANPSGTVGGGDVRDVQVTCVTNGYLVSGQVFGLLGTGLQVTNGTDTIQIAADGPFRFPTALQPGQSYNVAMVTPPNTPAQGCFVWNGTGMIQGQDVTNVEIRCSIIAPPF